MACGVFISSVKFSGQTCQVTFLDASSNLTYQLGNETIPFTYYPPDNSPQGTYFIYFSGTDTTYPLVVSGACPTPTPTPTVTQTVTPTVSPGLTPTMTPSVTATLTPTPTETSGYINDLFSTGNTIGSSCSSSNYIRLYSNEPFYTPNQDVFTNPGLSNFAPVGYYTNNGIVYNWDGFNFVSQGACPTPTPTVTSTATPTFGATPTPTPTPGGFNKGPFTFDFDYMLCEYFFTDGTDMDTVSYMTVPSIMESTSSDPDAIGPVSGSGKYYNYVGTCGFSDSGPQFPLSPSTPFLIYGGDNRSASGTESVLFDLIEFKSQNPGVVNIQFSFTADWYGMPGNNPIYMRATLWKGGTPVQVGFTWENTTATGTYLVESNGTVTTLNVQDCEPYELVSNLQYNINTFSGQFIS